MSGKKVLQVVAGLVLAGAGLAFFFRHPDLNVGVLIEQIKTTDIKIIGAIVILSVASLWLRALRWRILLPDIEKTHRKGLFSIVTIAFMVNNIMPARLGEAARAVLLWKKNNYTLTLSISSLVFERIIDSLVFLSFFFLPVLITGKIPQLHIYALIASGIFSLAIIAFFLYWRFPVFFASFSRKLTTYLPQKTAAFLVKTGREITGNLDWMFSFKKVFLVITLSYAIAFSYSSVILLLVGEPGSFGIIESMFGQAFAAFGAAIPLSPGFVGTLHAALLQGLVFLEVPMEKAGAAVVIYHALPFLVVTAVGLFFLISTNITFKDINDAANQVKSSKMKTDEYERAK
ncbi:lysylphosphatidylglycerol synthase transmembrane domain-containing protein [Chitinispirillales bacterium ANBcel5]|uniref:lysylphosphatidylglycerol synthase transmembrane domain-containing protein n=1 Tax=Cellulosispirillum alkaliphilum TaxID=3039283 RepID=UPI002A53207F|nr:lysylphosphatidylglycerol synthase transmembrane domain-containing protein [Chitinispirillales bacterium ANBcel5]